MGKTRFLSLLTALVCLLMSVSAAAAAEVSCDSVYCFSPEDFAAGEPLAGICITDLPDGEQGAALLGQRVLRPGDILTADQLARMTFNPVRSEADQDVSLTYLPIYEGRVAPAATMTLSIRGKENKAPAAGDFAVETYKNIPLQGKLKVTDPEGEAMTYTVTRQGRRGTVAIAEDGTFTYTPKKNKVGVDSFTYTAADPAGNVSREALVTITILKPTDAPQYTDTAGHLCRFTAEWMKNTGIFVGESLAGTSCFQPEKAVTRGEFLTMLVKTLELPTEDAPTGYTDDTPQWLRPYLAAAMRAGLTAGLPVSDSFGADEAITGGEAAVMLQNALDLAVSTAVSEEDENAHWAAAALLILREHGIELEADAPLTRAQASMALYTASRLAPEAPGTAVFRRQG